MGMHLEIFRFRMFIHSMMTVDFIVPICENMSQLIHSFTLFILLYHHALLFAMFFGKICNSIVFCLIVKYFQIL